MRLLWAYKHVLSARTAASSGETVGVGRAARVHGEHKLRACEEPFAVLHGGLSTVKDLERKRADGMERGKA